MPLVWSVVDFGEGSRGDQAQGCAVRAGAVAAGLAQAAVALPGGGVPSGVVHRGAARGPAQGQGDDPAAGRVRGRDRDSVLLRESRRGAKWAIRSAHSGRTGGRSDSPSDRAPTSMAMARARDSAGFLTPVLRRPCARACGLWRANRRHVARQVCAPGPAFALCRGGPTSRRCSGAYDKSALRPATRISTVSYHSRTVQSSEAKLSRKPCRESSGVGPP